MLHFGFDFGRRTYVQLTMTPGSVVVRKRHHFGMVARARSCVSFAQRDLIKIDYVKID